MKKRKRLCGRKALVHEGQATIFHGLPIKTSGDMSEEKLQALEREYSCHVRREKTPTTLDLIHLLDESIAQIERGDWELGCELPYCEAQVATACRQCPARDDRCTGFSQEEDLIFFDLLRVILVEQFTGPIPHEHWLVRQTEPRICERCMRRLLVGGAYAASPYRLLCEGCWEVEK